MSIHDNLTDGLLTGQAVARLGDKALPDLSNRMAIWLVRPHEVEALLNQIGPGRPYREGGVGMPYECRRTGHFVQEAQLDVFGNHSPRQVGAAADQTDVLKGHLRVRNAGDGFRRIRKRASVIEPKRKTPIDKDIVIFQRLLDGHRLLA